MRLSTLLYSGLLAGAASAAPPPPPPPTTPSPPPPPRGPPGPAPPGAPGGASNEFLDWRTFKGNGANLGAWLAKEKGHDPLWWKSLGGAAAETPDEWTLCAVLGDQCGPVLEARYASFLNTSTIDQLASVGVNVLRVPTTYAPWVEVPGSQYHRGNQLKFLSTISNYAIEKYGMHVIIDLHSLPGGVNGLDIGESFGHMSWFNNQTNLDYSFAAIDSVLAFIKDSGHMNSFTISPLNEAADNLEKFAMPEGLSASSADWILKYMNGVLAKVDAVDRRIPVMLQDSFQGAAFWASRFEPRPNLVMDVHVYFFAVPDAFAHYLVPSICTKSRVVAEDKKFPTFIGEWSLQALHDNSLAVADRKTLFDTQRFAWQRSASGGSFWNAVSYSDTPVDGEGIQEDYWSYVDLIKAGVITKPTPSRFC
ncbi:glycoside hydrolase [Apiospora arundinis]|uniref:glucan 1,3-beta-glucosidase n=1 Tax=Apiospora arundinis TaxID=335852 RepID=A0ABR2HQU7_9PEZI